MVQKSGDHQLRLVVYPIIYKVSSIPGGGLGFLNHQEYGWWFLVVRRPLLLFLTYEHASVETGSGGTRFSLKLNYGKKGGHK